MIKEQMKRVALIISVFSMPVYAVTNEVIHVKGAITPTTCTFTADSEVNFNTITALNINNNVVPEKDINMTAVCDWTVSNMKISFIPGSAGLVNGDVTTMKSGLGGVGFKLPSMGSLTNLAFNTEHLWAAAGPPHGGAKTLAVKIKPVKIPSEEIIAGSVDTMLTIRLSYD